MKYYSFLIGTFGEPKSNWIRFDLKLPAMSPKEAITLHYFHELYHYKYQRNYIIKDFKFEEPTQDYVFLKYRMVIEYERSFYRKSLYSRHTYRKIREIPTHRIKHQFQKRELAGPSTVR